MHQYSKSMAPTIASNTSTTILTTLEAALVCDGKLDVRVHDIRRHLNDVIVQ